MFTTKFRYLYIFLLGTYSFANIKFTEGDRILSNDLGNLWLFSLILLLTVVIWEGNRFVQESTFQGRKKLSSQLIFRFIVSLGLVGFTSMASSFIIHLFLETEPSFPAFRQIIGFTFRINLFLHSINAIYSYNRELSNTRLVAEQLQKQSTEAKLETLRSQINPHFLFNNFNTLISIIEEDTQTAVNYTKELSKVYRYLLKNENKDLVPLEEEIKFLQSYIYLLKIRFQNDLQVEIKIPNVEGIQIPPSTLQLLVENAIKHNEASAARPLQIRIFEQNKSIVVQNNVQKRTDEPEQSGIGLENIRNRYALLSSRLPNILHSEGSFEVTLPLI